MTSTSQTQCGESSQPQQVRLACTYRGNRGILTADLFGCIFTADVLKMDFPWSSVKWIRVKTKHVNDKPTSVLALKTKKVKTLSTWLFNSERQYFYYFTDIVEASRLLNELYNQWSAMKASPKAGSPADSGGSCSESRKFPMDGSSCGSFAFANYGIKLNNDNGHNNNNNNNKNDNNRSEVVASLSVFDRGKSLESDALHIDYSANDCLLGPMSLGQNKKVNSQLRDDSESCDYFGHTVSSSGGGGGCSMSLPFIKVSRHNELKEVKDISTKNVLRHSANKSGLAKKRVGNRHEVNNPTFTSFFDVFGCQNIFHSLSSLQIGIIITVFLLAFLLIVGKVAFVGQKRNMSADDTLNLVIRGLKQAEQWRMERNKITFEENSKRDSPLMMESFSIPPTFFTFSDMTIAVKKLLARYVRIQQEIIVLRLHRMRRKYAAVDSTFNRNYNNQNIDDVNNVQLLSGGGGGGGKASFKNDEHYFVKKFSDYNSEWFLNELKQKVEQRRLMEYIISFLRWLWHFMCDTLFNVREFLGKKKRGVCDNTRNDAETIVKNNFEKNDLTRYTEVLANGQVIATNISVEDSKERHMCLQLTRELLHSSKLLETILLDYQDLIMAPMYESYLYRMPFTAAAAATVNTREKSTGSKFFMRDNKRIKNVDEKKWMINSGELLHSMLLRRHTTALLNLEPLLYPEMQQYKVSNAKKKSSQYTSFEESYNESASSSASGGGNGGKRLPNLEPTREKVEAILRKFLATTARKSSGRSRSSTNSRGNSSKNNNNNNDGGDKRDSNRKYTRSNNEKIWFKLRNILREVQYWGEHEEEWQTVVLWRLNTSANNRGAGEMLKSTSEEDMEFRNSIALLPLFRGLWCFLDQPIELSAKKDNVNTNNKMGENKETREMEFEEKADLLIPDSTHFADNGSAALLAEEREEYVPGDVHDCDGVCEESGEGYDTNAELSGLREKVKSFSKNENEEEEYAESSETTRSPTVNGEFKTVGQPTIHKTEKKKEIKTNVLEAKRRKRNVMVEEPDNLGIRTYELMSQKVHLSWLNAFELFIHAHTDKQSQSSVRNKMFEKAALWGSDTAENGMTNVRRRFLRLLAWGEKKYERYLAKDVKKLMGVSAAFLDFSLSQCSIRQAQSRLRIFWPLSWFGAHNTMQIHRCLLRQLTASDPVVCKLHSDILGLRLCEVEDFSWMLLYSFALPPEVLKTYYDTVTLLNHSSWVFLVVLFIAVAVVAFCEGRGVAAVVGVVAVVVWRISS